MWHKVVQPRSRYLTTDFQTSTSKLQIRYTKSFYSWNPSGFPSAAAVRRKQPHLEEAEHENLLLESSRFASYMGLPKLDLTARQHGLEGLEGRLLTLLLLLPATENSLSPLSLHGIALPMDGMGGLGDNHFQDPSLGLG